MSSYCVMPRDNSDECYWIKARDPKEARRLVALNVPAARLARKARLFDCSLDTTKQPPVGFIYCRRLGPIAIERF